MRPHTTQGGSLKQGSPEVFLRKDQSSRCDPTRGIPLCVQAQCLNATAFAGERETLVKALRRGAILVGIISIVILVVLAFGSGNAQRQIAQPPATTSSWDGHRVTKELERARASHAERQEKVRVSLKSLERAEQYVQESFDGNPPVAVSAAVAEAERIAQSRSDDMVQELDDAVGTIRQEALDWRLRDIFENGNGAVDVIDLETTEEVYRFQAKQPMTAASTYKLFVLYDILNHLERGELSQTDTIQGIPIDSCLHDMIVYSENDCSEAWLNLRGRGTMEAVAQGVGATGTTFEPRNLLTTAEDLAQFLEQLYLGELLNEENTKTSLTFMAEQIYTEGIATGVGPRVEAASKVGWLDDVYNDAAIVSGSKGTYALVVLTSDLPVAATAEAAEAIYKWL